MKLCAFTDGGFGMMTSHIVVFNSIVVNVVQNGQTLSISFRLGSSCSPIRPRISSFGNGFTVPIFPNQTSASTDFGSGPEIIVTVPFKHIQEEISCWRIVHWDHFHANLLTRGFSLRPSVLGSVAIFPLDVVPFAVVFNIGHSWIAVVGFGGFRCGFRCGGGCRFNLDWCRGGSHTNRGGSGVPVNGVLGLGKDRERWLDNWIFRVRRTLGF